MGESILVPVHLGYAREKGEVSDKYGNYDEYLSKVKSAIGLQSSIIFFHKDGTPPFELPEGVESMRDMSTTDDPGRGIIDLTTRLKEKGASSVHVCGEFLWEYTQLASEGSIGRLREAYKTAQESGMHPLALRMSNMLQDTIENRVGDLTRVGARGCCVPHVYKELRKEFDVGIVRDLCYPTIDPQ